MAERLLVAAGRRADLAALGVASASGSTTRRTAFRSTTICGCRPTGSGPSATSPARGRSPTCRCTRPTSWSTTSSASQVTRPTTGPCPGSPSPIPRSARSVSASRPPAQGRDEVGVGMHGDPGVPGGGSTRRATGGSSSWSRTPTAACWSGPRRPGPVGGEVLGLLTLAVHAEVPTVAQLRRMIYAYPTFHRAIEDALKDLVGPDGRDPPAPARHPGPAPAPPGGDRSAKRGGRGTGGTRRRPRPRPTPPRTRTR